MHFLTILDNHLIRLLSPGCPQNEIRWLTAHGARFCKRFVNGSNMAARRVSSLRTSDFILPRLQLLNRHRVSLKKLAQSQTSIFSPQFQTNVIRFLTVSNNTNSTYLTPIENGQTKLDGHAHEACGWPPAKNNTASQIWPPVVGRSLRDPKVTRSIISKTSK